MGMRIDAQAGTEKWIRWAKHKATQLASRLKKQGLVKLTRMWEPEAGTQVLAIVSRWATWIQITGGSIRAWGLPAVSGSNVSPAIRFTVGGAVMESFTQSFTLGDSGRADWSQNYKIFPFTSGSGVVIRRGEGELILEDHDALPEPLPTSTYRNLTAIMDGDYTLLVPATPTADHIATVVTWNEDSEAFEQTYIPAPPGVYEQYDAVDPSDGDFLLHSSPGFDTTEFAGAEDYSWELVGIKEYHPIYYPHTPRIPSMTGHKVWAHPEAFPLVYVDVRGHRPFEIMVELNNPTGNSAQYTVMKVEPFGEVWSYNLDTEEWALVYSADWGEGFDVFNGEYASTGSGSHGFVVFSQHAKPGYYRPAFLPDGTLTVISMDDRDAAVEETGGTLNDVPTKAYFTYYSRTRKTPAAIRRDDSAWISEVDLVDSAAGYRGLEIAAVGALRRGAVRVTDSSPAVNELYWVHGSSDTDETQVALTQLTGARFTAGKFSKSSDIAYFASPGEAYYRGSTVLDLDEAIDGEFVPTLTSARNERNVLSKQTVEVLIDPGSPGSPGGTVTQRVQGYSAYDEFDALLFSAGPGDTSGLSLDGALIYFEEEDGIGSAPVSELPPGWYVIGSGVEYDLEVTTGATDPVDPTYEDVTSLVVSRLNLPADSESPWTLSTVFVVPLEVAGDVSPALTGALDIDKVVPDEFVVG